MFGAIMSDTAVILKLEKQEITAGHVREGRKELGLKAAGERWRPKMAECQSQILAARRILAGMGYGDRALKGDMDLGELMTLAKRAIAATTDMAFDLTQDQRLLDGEHLL